ncbi:MAG: sulfatase-like hydrolase/transferase [Myxococcota bacterium]
MWWALASCTQRESVVQAPHEEPGWTDPFTYSTIHLPPDGDAALGFAGPRPRNVLMLSIDTTRRDHFGDTYTPFLAGQSRQGVNLADHQQCSNWTYASTSCTLNGRYHEENGFVPQLSALFQAPMPDGQRTLATRLRDRGYHTILLSTNGWLGPKWNNAQGYLDAPTPFTSNATVLGNEGKARLLELQPDQPWFLHLHFIEPHPPYNPPAAYLDEVASLPPLPEGIDVTTQQGQYAANADWPEMTEEERDLLEAHLRGRYHGELRYLDDQLAALWADFEASGFLSDTLVVVWTDHGEQFWEHDQQSHAYFLGAEENDGVAFFWSHNLPASEWTEPTHAVDLAPTVLEAVGFPPDPTEFWFSGYVLGTAPDERPRFAMSVARLGPLQSVTLDGWKLTFNFAGVVRLYDRNTDPEELVDLYETDPENEHVLPLWTLLRPRIELLSALVPTRPLVWPEGLPGPGQPVE